MSKETLIIGALNLSPYITYTGKFERLTDLVFLPNLPYSIRDDLTGLIGRDRYSLPPIYYSPFPLIKNKAWGMPSECNVGWYPHKELTTQRLVFAFFGASHFLCLIFRSQL
jgi:hypothetical protein